jgi:phosphate transport system ATP-binding protein
MTQTTTVTDTVIEIKNLNVYYGSNLAVRDVNIDIPQNYIVSFIGPSGCGKSTVLRCLNRMNDLISICRVDGTINYHDQNIYAKSVDPVGLRCKIGMVFQQPNPFPKSIYENIAFGVRLNGFKGSKTEMDHIVEESLQKAAVWDEVKDKLQESGLALSGGQQQRLCIARTIAVQPDVILMDEPCAALDPISTIKVEETIHELKKDYTIVIVTHNMQQASRVSDLTAFYNAEATDKGGKVGYLVEYDQTETIFQNPANEATRDYVSGRFG